MRGLNVILIGLIGIGVAIPLVAHRQGNAMLRAQMLLIQKQAALIGNLSVDNARLSNSIARSVSPTPTGAELAEVLKLRNEITQLQHTPEELERVRHQIAQLKQRLQDAAEEESFGTAKSTALLSEEMSIRQSREVRLKQWLGENPEERIPEMQFVPENRWIDRADSPLVTDDDYRSAIGLLRADGEQRFVPMLYKALKGYANANNNQFPSDLSQLKPYFEKPIDDAMLERWTIVPAKTLVPNLAETGGDWLITEKAPINKRFDGRMAVGLTSYRGTVAEGRWDPMQ